MDKEELKTRIRNVFAHFEYPGDWCLSGSTEGDEPQLVAQEFAGKSDWTALDPQFLDQSPDGLSSALSFFSDEAFHYFLPAYLIADIDGRLERVDPVFHLTFGIDDESKHNSVNPRRYGRRTWYEEFSYRFSMFDREEVRVIIAYLQLKSASDAFDAGSIHQALNNYWLPRYNELATQE